MKTLLVPFLACLAIAPGAFAGGGKDVKESKVVQTPAPEPCFKDREFQIDAFGSYTDGTKRNGHGDGFGGGIAANYFFMKTFGVGVDGNIYNGNVNGAWDLGGRLIARFPIEGRVCVAPYIFAGGGVSTDGSTVGTWNTGGGLEWRVTHSIGIFGEGRYTWGEDRDAAQARIGIRFIF